MATRCKKTAAELKEEAQRLLKKARELERQEQQKRYLDLGKWAIKNQDEIRAILPPDLAAEFANFFSEKT